MPASADDGFTLLEVLVALVVLSLVASLVGAAAPKGQERAALAATVAVLDEQLKRSRALAERQQIAVSVALDTQARTIASPQSGAAWTWPLEVEVAVKGLQAEGRPHQALITFLADGTSSGGAIQMRAGRYIAFRRVEWLTGAIHHDP